MNCVAQDLAFGRLKEHIIASTGLAFYADRDKPLIELIGERLAALGLRDCSSYTDFLTGRKNGHAEMDVLIARLTIGETYFFRDEEQFAAIRDVILPEILERKRSSKQLRIWSAGCATGAEPYSLAILLAREADRIAGWKISIHATDLNRGFLDRAAEGKFRAAAFRATSDQVKHECFSAEGPTWTIHPQYKQWISFHQMNLVEGEFSMPWLVDNSFDLILCRNVMIYFSREVNSRLIGQFHQSLGEGGWLVVGGCEYNLDNLKVFRTVTADGARLFQKVAVPREAALSGRPLKKAPAPPAPRSTPAPAPGPISSNTDTIPGASLNAENAAVSIEGLRRLANHGEWQNAAEYGRRLLAQNGLNAETHFYHALVLEKLGIVDEPERSLRHAIYLDRNFALAHFHLGLTLKRGGQARGAARSFGNVLRVLAGVPDLAVLLAGPGVTVTGLKEIAKMHLANARTS